MSALTPKADMLSIVSEAAKCQQRTSLDHKGESAGVT
jgi:hypothetical protein